MKRDIDLMRTILLTIEERYTAGEGKIFCLNVNGYEMAEIGEHCELLYQQSLINTYEPIYAGSGLKSFFAGNLTAQGYDYLEIIRDDKVWEKTKQSVEEKKLPKTIEFLAKIAGIFAGNALGEMNG